ncbi:MAG: UDP-N-acetylmuramoyl-L-alanine--D-glutamate ligase [SAR86 cluster bacterium]|nr:UDP-N-acetylmuramoyl-L-alanine--D-glutamate ligase [SAR86 cluster bacterium]
MKQDKPYLVLGLGKTGASVADYLHSLGKDFYIYDDHLEPSGLLSVKDIVNKEKILLRKFNLKLLSNFSKLIVSPGIKPSHAILIEAFRLKLPVITDFDIFFRQNSSLVILVTGTNGKTTVVSMLEKVLKARFGRDNVQAGGNIGTPVLDLLKKEAKINILEISSFQLELTEHIYSDISLLLNLEEDHLDWHGSIEAYQKAKKRVFEKTSFPILESQLILEEIQGIDFNNYLFDFFPLIDQGINSLWPDHLKSNLLATLTVLFFVEKLNDQSIALQDVKRVRSILDFGLKELRDFSLLPHRFEMIGSIEDVIFINDSKSTNISSSIAAIKSVENLYNTNNIHLIFGGDAKSQDFNNLKYISQNKVKKVYLFGKDADKLNDYFSKIVETDLSEDLEGATNRAQSCSFPGDVILLSPGCSSLDMYENYIQRGIEFKRILGL